MSLSTSQTAGFLSPSTIASLSPMSQLGTGSPLNLKSPLELAGLSDLSVPSNLFGASGGLSTASQPAPTGSGGTDRLAEILPRSAAALLNGSSLANVPSDLSNRGPIAKIKLRTTEGLAPDGTGSSWNLTSAYASLQAGTFDEFFLVNVDLDLDEKMQISQTFGDSEVIYFFGRQPISITISGVLFDGLNLNWFGQYLALWSGNLRGTQLALRRNLVEIHFPSFIAVGTFTTTNLVMNSSSDATVSFTAKFLAKSIQPIAAPSPGLLNYTASTSTSNILDWSVGRDGLGGTSFSAILYGGLPAVPVLDPGIRTVAAAQPASLSFLNSLSSFGKGVFSPVFTILASVTNIVKTAGLSLENLVSDFTTPLNNLLGTVNSIIGKATSIVTAVEGTVSTIAGDISSVATNFYSTLQLARNSIGIIAQVPQSFSQSLQALESHVNNSFNSFSLFMGPNSPAGAGAFLSSGSRYKPTAPYSL